MSNYGKKEMEKADIAERELLNKLCFSLFHCGVKEVKTWEHREGEALLDNGELVEVKFDSRCLDTRNVCIEYENNNPKRNGFNVGWFYDCDERGVDWLVYVLYRPNKGGWKFCGAIAIYFPLLRDWVYKNMERLNNPCLRYRHHSDNDSCFWVVPVVELQCENVVRFAVAFYPADDGSNDGLRFDWIVNGEGNSTNHDTALYYSPKLENK